MCVELVRWCGLGGVCSYVCSYVCVDLERWCGCECRRYVYVGVDWLVGMIWQ